MSCALRLGRSAAGLLRLEQVKTRFLRETLALRRSSWPRCPRPT